MEHVFFLTLLLVAALSFALLEVQIEGDHGWASGLPTWRYQNRWTTLVLGNRAVTGYHVYFHLLVLALAHAPFGLSLVAWSLYAEARVIAFVILFWIVEDYLWFVVNPSYGAKRFRARHAWWHAANWWGFMPRDYWIFLPIGIALYVYSWM